MPKPDIRIAKHYFAAMKAKMAAEAPPLPMGETAALKVSNIFADVTAGHIAPVEMIFRAPG